MSKKEAFKKILEILNNKIVLKDYKFQKLNWVHAIRIIIFNLEYDKFITNNFGEQNKKELESDPKTKAESSIKYRLFSKILKLKLYRKIKQYYLFVHSIKEILNFYCITKYLKLVKKRKIINFSVDNFDVQYGEKYFDPHSDNINLDEIAINLCIPVWRKKEQVKKAYFKRIVIEDSFNAYSLLFSERILINTDFLIPLKEILEEDIFIKLENNIKKVYKYYSYFLFVLKTLKPKKIFLFDSANIYSLALIAAGKKSGIQTIEQQHGNIYPLHLGYCYNYTNVSQTDFICDQLHYYTKPLIDWTKQDWVFHPKLVEIKFSPAFQLWTKFKDTEKDEKLQKLILKVSGLKVITFGLTNEILPDWLIESIEKLSHDFFICFRLHPRFASGNKHQIIELQNKIPNSDYEYSSFVSLYNLLDISNYFIAGSSATLLDALSFNLTTICISEDYANMIFRPYIQQGLILVATNKDELNNAISN